MKKGILIGVIAVAVAGAGVAGYSMYQAKAAEQYTGEVTGAVSDIASAGIEVTEGGSLPDASSVFAGKEEWVDMGSITADIQSVDTTTPGSYEVKYAFKDVKGNDRTLSVGCTVIPELTSHVYGLGNITIDQGEDVPEEADCSYDEEYVSYVILNTDNVEPDEAGVYDISYSILGMNGDMKDVTGYTCTVNAAPTPTPTPTPTPSPTPKPTATPKPSPTATPKPKKTDAETDAALADADGAAGDAGSPQLVGNVEPQDSVVATGDNSQIGLTIAILALAVAAIVFGVFKGISGTKGSGKKKKKKKR